MKRMAVLLFLFVVLALPVAAYAEVGCATCHDSVTCASCHATAPVVVAPPVSVVKEPTFDPEVLTHSAFGPDGTYYLYVPHDVSDVEAEAPGGLMWKAERLTHGEHDIVTVGPGMIYAEVTDDTPAEPTVDATPSAAETPSIPSEPATASSLVGD